MRLRALRQLRINLDKWLDEFFKSMRRQSGTQKSESLARAQCNRDSRCSGHTGKGWGAEQHLQFNENLNTPCLYSATHDYPASVKPGHAHTI